MKVITATSGKLLRDYIKTLSPDERVVIFPEHGLDANEQAAFLLENEHKYDTVITLSSFIISDSKNLTVLGELESKPKFGESVNKITMNLWRGETIGDLAQQKINDLEEVPASKELIATVLNEIGDSLERVFLLHKIKSDIKEQEKSEDVVSLRNKNRLG